MLALAEWAARAAMRAAGLTRALCVQLRGCVVVYLRALAVVVFL